MSTNQVKYDYNAESLLVLADNVELPELTWTPGDWNAEWREDALCNPANARTEADKTLSSELHYLNEEGERVDEVRANCVRCPKRAFCLVDAVNDSNAEGWRANHFFVGGGLNANSRRVLWLRYKLRVGKRRRNV